MMEGAADGSKHPIGVEVQNAKHHQASFGHKRGNVRAAKDQEQHQRESAASVFAILYGYIGAGVNHQDFGKFGLRAMGIAAGFIELLHQKGAKGALAIFFHEAKPRCSYKLLQW